MERIGYAEVTSKTFHHVERCFMNQEAFLFLLDAAKRGERRPYEYERSHRNVIFQPESLWQLDPDARL